MRLQVRLLERHDNDNLINVGDQHMLPAARGAGQDVPSRPRGPLDRGSLPVPPDPHDPCAYPGFDEVDRVVAAAEGKFLAAAAGGGR